MSRFERLQVNQKVARLNAAWVVLFALVFVFFPLWRFIIFVPVVNFLVMGFLGPWYSPISQLNKAILRALKIQPAMIYAPPKIFAAKIGFFLSLVGTILYLINYPIAAVVVIAVLGFFALLEVVFGFCMGCWAHSFIYKNLGNG